MVAIRFDASALQTQENKSIIIEETSKTQDRYLLENHLIQWLRIPGVSKEKKRGPRPERRSLQDFERVNTAAISHLCLTIQ
jgi:hypothetical protein